MQIKYRCVMDDKVVIYSDGACSGNPGPGGYGAIIRYKDNRKEVSGWQAHTTNNQMEMMAAIAALQSLKRPCNVEVYTDSTYLQKGVSEWLPNWLKKGSLDSSANQKIKNRELWKQLQELTAIHQVSWHWVKAHNGDKYNELADQIACEMRDLAKKKLQRNEK